MHLDPVLPFQNSYMPQHQHIPRRLAGATRGPGIQLNGSFGSACVVRVPKTLGDEDEARDMGCVEEGQEGLGDEGGARW